MSKEVKMTRKQKAVVIDIFKEEIHEKAANGVPPTLEDEEKIDILKLLFSLPLKELLSIKDKYIIVN